MKFDSKDPKYKPIKITNIVLLVILFFFELIAQDAQGIKSPNLVPVVITFFISRYIVRKMFTNNPDFTYKIIKTIGVWFGVLIVKAILVAVLLASM